MTLTYIDRKNKQKKIEKVYKKKALQFFYSERPLSRTLGRALLFPLAKVPFLSSIYGWLQRQKVTKRQIRPFIKEFEIDCTEFEKRPEEFLSFDDFFTRGLKREARPIVENPNVAIIPADGRYYFFQNIEEIDTFNVKGEHFSLEEFLNDKALGERYKKGALALGRLAPPDYHRFHFPTDSFPDQPKLINGYLYSVNPIAIRKNFSLFSQNKRVLTLLHTELFGDILFVEIGATCVGTIHQTFKPHQFHKKGEEKGYFSFGGSQIACLFPEGSIQFDQDLIEATKEGVEIFCQMGQSMGKAIKKL